MHTQNQSSFTVNDGLPLMSVAGWSGLGAQKFILDDVPFLPDYDTLILIDAKNRDAAEADIMMVQDLLVTAREINGRVPVVRIYSDDIRYEGSSALEPSLFTYIEPADNRGKTPETRRHALLLHYYITPDERNVIHGDIYYGEDGNIIKFTIAFEREGENFFICAEGGEDNILTVTNVVCGEKKRRRRFYPLIKIDRHAGYVISGTLVVVAAFTILAVIMAGIGIEARRDPIISLPPVHEAEDSTADTNVPEPNADESNNVEPNADGSNNVEPNADGSNITEPNADGSNNAEPNANASNLPVPEQNAAEPEQNISVPEQNAAVPEQNISVPEQNSPAPSETEPPISVGREQEGDIVGQNIAAVPEDGLTILSLTSPVKRGETAVLTAMGTADVIYSISVMYSSGRSSADGLEEKAAGADGVVEWSWKIGSRTKAGRYSVIVAGADESAETFIEIVE